MESGSCWGPHDIAFANVTIFAASLPRVYCACTTSMEMLWRLAHDLRDPTAFSPRSRWDCRTLALFWACSKQTPWLGDHWRSLATMATTARCLAFLPRLYHVYTTLMAILARSGPIFRRRRRAVRTPPRCDGGITELASRPVTPHSISWWGRMLSTTGRFHCRTSRKPGTGHCSTSVCHLGAGRFGGCLWSC